MTHLERNMQNLKNKDMTIRKANNSEKLIIGLKEHNKISS
jgi:hypothetical protein